MRKSLIIFLISQIVALGVFAQSNYPIFVTPTLTPPYSLNLSDYSKLGSQQLMVTLRVNDLNISNLPVKLRIKMEAVGVTIENPPTINATPIYIDGGTTSILFGTDLTDYFNINNLVFKGYSKEAYNRTGQLPEGFYRFTVEVLHFNTNRPISNQGTTSAWIALGKPPLLKLPGDNAQMGQFKGMPISFSWLASNVGSPASAGTIQYKFEMWEMRVQGVDPNTVAASMPVFHEHTSFNTLYSLYPVSLLMEPGMRYAWRVTASDISGFVPFEQNGHSEIRTFIYKAKCDSITGLSSKQKGHSGLFTWETQSNHTSFNVEMRNPLTGWMSNSETYEPKAEFFDLKYGTSYEMRVQAVCDGDPDSKSDFSDWKEITIQQPEPLFDSASCPECTCDDDIPDSGLENFELRYDLQPGDTIVNKTGTTRFIVKTVEDQGGGTYKGIFLFWAEIWNLKIICNYWDLQVNTEDVIVNMDFESVYDPQFVLDVDATVDYLNNLANAIATLTPDAQIKDTVSFNQPISSVYVNAGDSVIAVTVDENGNLNEVVLSNNSDNLEKTLIQGENGEEYVINKDGTAMGVKEYMNTNGGKKGKVSDYNKQKEENSLSAGKTVLFAPSARQKYGFDSYNDKKASLQSAYPSLSNGYRPAYKSIASFNTDVVGVSDAGSNIVFKDEMGIPALLTGEDLTLRGASAGSSVALYAYEAVNDSTEEIVGKLNLLSFDEQTKRLFIVPVNGATIPSATELQQKLNSIYAQAVTNWEVIEMNNLSGVVFEGTSMTHGGTSAISVYNKDQRAIAKSFEQSYGKMEKNAHYLFFVENVQFKDRSLAGYMPLQRQVGFIYDNPGLNTVAHELAHGAFNLYHTFSTKNFIANEHSTENLMDYTGGEELWKHQWDLIHDPESMLFAFLQDEEEGALVDEGTELTITYEGLNDDFEPGKKDLSIEYSIAKFEDIAKEHKDVTKAFLWIIKDEEIVYTKDLPLKNTNTITWDGKSNSGETETEIDGLSEFTIKIGVTIEYDYSIGNVVEWLFTEDVDFKLSSEKEREWSVLKWKKDYENFEHKESMQSVSEDRYKARKEQYKTRLEALGVNTTETSPLEYLNEHLVSGDFLGQEIPSINIRFLYFVRKLEEELGRGKKWSQNSSTFNNYCSLAPFIQDYARMSSVGSSISDHGTGFAFDFDKDKNPWLGSENVQQDKLIQIVTGKKMRYKTYSVFSGNGANEIKQASDDFLERIEGNGFDIEQESILDTIFTRINKYAGKVTLIEEDKSQDFNNVVTGLVSTLQENITSKVDITPNELIIQKQSLEEATSSTITILEGAIRDLDKLKILFDASKDGLFINYDMGNNYEQLYSFITDYKTKSNSIITYLEGVANLPTTSGTAWNDGINTLKNNLSPISFSSGYQSHLTQFVTKFNEKKNILGNGIEDFPQELKEETDGRNSYMGGTLFENGFCSLDESLVKAIIQTKITLNNVEMRLMWGGSYYSTKDIMHFELRKQAGNADRPYQTAVHGIEMQDIKDYLNSFKNKNGGDYDY